MSGLLESFNKVIVELCSRTLQISATPLSLMEFFQMTSPCIDLLLVSS